MTSGETQGDTMSATAIMHLPSGWCMVDADVVVRPDHIFMAEASRVASRTVAVGRKLSYMRPEQCHRYACRSRRGCNRVKRKRSDVWCGLIFAAREDRVALRPI